MSFLTQATEVFRPRTFHFTRNWYEEADATASLCYRFDDGPEMVETIRFRGAEGRLDADARAGLDRALRELHLAAGVSYYKAGVPEFIERDDGPLSHSAAAFFRSFYREGLGEFAWRNELDLGDRPRFSANGDEGWQAAAVKLRRRTAVPVGGGKDSIVAMEKMRASGDDVVLVSVGSSPLIADVAQRSGLPHLAIERRLAPELMQLNEQGALNGHVPITGIIGFILVCGAIVYGYDTVVMANERSASIGNLLRPDGSEVNHQYSKSLAFEASFDGYINENVLPGFSYFSLLRPLSELDIARHFSFHEQYFELFSSCNRNFTQAQGSRRERWCRNCPKCRFVFLMLAPFIPRHRLVGIFGGNLLADGEQIEGYRALVGRGGNKPFDCVGEPDECQAAFALLTAHPDWRDDTVVAWFSRELLPGLDDADALAQRVLRPAGEHRIPARYRSLLDAPG